MHSLYDTKLQMAYRDSVILCDMHKSRAVLRHQMAELLSPKLLLVKNKFCSKKRKRQLKKRLGQEEGKKLQKLQMRSRC